MSKRLRGLAISRPILIGSTSTPLTPAEKQFAPPDHTHRWTVAVRSAASAPLAPLAQDGAGARNDAEATSAIGTRLRDSELDLHRAVGGKDDLSYFIKRVQFRLHDTYAQPTRNIDKAPFSVTETGWGEFEVQIKIFFVPEAGEKPLTVLHHLKLHPWAPASAEVDATHAHESAPGDAPAPQARADQAAAGASEAPPQGAGAAPAPEVPAVVHSWQYEEIVFPEPLEPFYELLLAHPPTPWPATSADAYVDAGGQSGALPHTVHTPTGQVISALSLEAQRAEADRIDLARANAVKQLDADRAKLISTEKLVREARARLAQLEGARANAL